MTIQWTDTVKSIILRRHYGKVWKKNNGKFWRNYKQVAKWNYEQRNVYEFSGWTEIISLDENYKDILTYDDENIYMELECNTDDFTIVAVTKYKGNYEHISTDY